MQVYVKNFGKSMKTWQKGRGKMWTAEGQSTKTGHLFYLLEGQEILQLLYKSAIIIPEHCRS